MCVFVSGGFKIEMTFNTNVFISKHDYMSNWKSVSIDMEIQFEQQNTDRIESSNPNLYTENEQCKP